MSIQHITVLIYRAEKNLFGILRRMRNAIVHLNGKRGHVFAKTKISLERKFLDIFINADPYSFALIAGAIYCFFGAEAGMYLGNLICD